MRDTTRQTETVRDKTGHRYLIETFDPHIVDALTEAFSVEGDAERQRLTEILTAQQATDLSWVRQTVNDLQNRIGHLEIALHGNGSQGLRTDVRLIQESLHRREKQNWLLWTALVAALAKFIFDLITLAVAGSRVP